MKSTVKVISKLEQACFTMQPHLQQRPLNHPFSLTDCTVCANVSVLSHLRILYGTLHTYILVDQSMVGQWSTISSCTRDIAICKLGILTGIGK